MKVDGTASNHKRDAFLLADNLCRQWPGASRSTWNRLSVPNRRELRGRSAIDATIGSMKTDGRLDRTFLLGRADGKASRLWL